MTIAAAKTSIAILSLSLGIVAAPALAQNRGAVAHEGPAPRAALRNLYASINGQNATINRGVGVVRVRRIDNPAGTYVVHFNRNVTSCFYLATLGLGGFESSEDPGSITTVRSAQHARGVYVATFDATGVLANRSFFLHVACPD
jgi:hypothetical protein